MGGLFWVKAQMQDPTSCGNLQQGIFHYYSIHIGFYEVKNIMRNSELTNQTAFIIINL